MLPEERILLKAALIVSLLGMLLLLFISYKLPKESSEKTLISSLEEMPEGTHVSIAGTVEAIQQTPTIIIITIKDTSGSIKVVANNKNLQTSPKKKGAIEVEGTLKEYRGKQEIEAITLRIQEE